MVMIALLPENSADIDWQISTSKRRQAAAREDKTARHDMCFRHRGDTCRACSL
ncbi:MAG TPA: hypothetical protein VF516_27160 [Kofleriaceae bacterium]